MTTQWNSKALGTGATGGGAPAGNIMDESVVILMQGKNTFGDRIYSYLKVTLTDLKRMQTAVQQNQSFNPSDFGTIVAAGKGEPTDEIKAEVAAMYKVLDSGRGTAAPAAPPPEQKAWDDY